MAKAQAPGQSPKWCVGPKQGLILAFGAPRSPSDLSLLCWEQLTVRARGLIGSSQSSGQWVGPQGQCEV